MNQIFIIAIIAVCIIVVALILYPQEEKNPNPKKLRSKNKYRKSFFDFLKPPKHHNVITTIVRLLAFLSLGFIIVAMPYSILLTVYKWGYVTLGIIIVFPGYYIVISIIKRIKVGQHYSERNKKIKRVIERKLNKNDYIYELEKLSELKDKGIITDEEFQAKKNKLLDL